MSLFPPLPARLCALLPLGFAFACGSDGGDTSAGLPAPDEGTFSVLSYNVHGLPDLLTNTSRPGVERMAEISPLLNAYDLIGLQEVFTVENHDAVLAETEHGFVETFNTPLNPDRAYGAGLEILASIGQHLESESLFYDTCYGTIDGSGDCLASKGVQLVTFDLGDAPLTLINTHHEAGGGLEDEEARERQVTQVIEALDALPSDRAVLYVGDFNLRESDPADAPLLDAYAAAGLRNLCHELDCDEPERIDRIHLRDSDRITLTGLSWWVAEEFVDEDGADLSDHDAIAGTIRWERK